MTAFFQHQHLFEKNVLRIVARFIGQCQTTSSAVQSDRCAVLSNATVCADVPLSTRKRARREE